MPELLRKDSKNILRIGSITESVNKLNEKIGSLEDITTKDVKENILTRLAEIDSAQTALIGAMHENIENLLKQTKKQNKYWVIWSIVYSIATIGVGLYLFLR